MNTEKSIKLWKCVEHCSNGCIKKSQTVHDSNEGGLRLSASSGCRACRKVLELFENYKDVQEGSHIQLPGETQRRPCT